MAARFYLTPESTVDGDPGLGFLGTAGLCQLWRPPYFAFSFFVIFLSRNRLLQNREILCRSIQEIELETGRVRNVKFAPPLPFSVIHP